MQMSHSQNTLNIIGVASCYGAQDLRCADGPFTLKQLHLKEELQKQGFNILWDKNIYPESMPVDKKSNTSLILDVCKQLSKQVHQSILNKQRFIIIGGDHSCAIGTWSGVHSALNNKLKTKLNKQNDSGLIWIDAHMDSHTPETSPSGAIHGMPIATLLGHGDEEFCNIAIKGPKLKPQNICLVGIRSFEKGEADLLEKLGVKVFYMDDIHKQGLKKILLMAKKHVSDHTSSYGLSIDLDAIDPAQAPGVGSPEKNGINGEELTKCLKNMDFSDNFLGIEIAELNSNKDDDDKTAKLAIEIIQATFL